MVYYHIKREAMTSYLDIFKELLDYTGAKYHDIFVDRPGVKIFSSSKLHDTDTIPPHYSMTADDFNALGEFKSRLCYLSYPRGDISDDERLKKTHEFNRKMIEEYGHTSVWNAFYVEFMIVGVSIETMIELLAHTESKVSRLTSSKTKAQNDTYYRLQGTTDEREIQASFIRQFLELKKSHAWESTRTEFKNMANLGTKCGALMYSMSIKDFRKMIAGRQGETGNETEIREIVSLMLIQLKNEYPAMFNDMSVNPLDQSHSLVNISKYERFIRNAGLLDNVIRKDVATHVVEVGVGNFEISHIAAKLNANLEENPYSYMTGIDIRQDFPDNVMVKKYNMMCHRMLFEIFSLQRFVPKVKILLVSNPPYSLMGNIIDYIKKNNAKYLLMTTVKWLESFEDHMIIGTFNGCDFEPMSYSDTDEHYLITNLLS